MLYFLLFLFLAAGLLLILAGTHRLPSIKERQRRKKLTGNNAKSLEAKFIYPLASKIAPHLRLSEKHHDELAEKLRLAGIDQAPEFYIARDVALTGIIVLFALVFLLLRVYILTAIILVAAVLVWNAVAGEVDEKIKKRQIAEGRELPQFMLTVIQSLLYDRNLVGIMDKYRETAGPQLRPDLDILVADMRMGNHEQALSRFADRVGNDNLSIFVSGLISQSRGVDQKVFLQSAERETKLLTVESLKREAMKKPEKLHKVEFMLVGAAFLFWIGALMLYMAHGFMGFGNY